ncbi:MAG: 2-C-methyl-D-erythritol 4-phosphate cytidylyltransferase [Oscillibacter sp.]|nr:2-C-methyl-D-erythritol 4-phosphate cytidylyltransferase [Oscillibacter sp.]
MFSFLRKSRPKCAALVPAAGSSQRMKGANKLFLPLCGAPVLVRSLMSLQLAQRVGEIVVAAREEDLEEVSRLCKEYGVTKCKKVVVGGATREESVLRAAMEAGRDAGLFAVHDGARPLVTPDLVDRVIEKAEVCGAAAPAVPLKDTIKRVKEGGMIERTVSRDALRAAQTPQVFDANLLKAALHAASESGAELTDDCSAVERLGKVVFLIDGEEENLKITTPVDLIFAEAVLKKRMGKS